MNANPKISSAKIKQKAKLLGFTDCKIAPAHVLEDDAEHFRNWLSNGMHADMHYMEEHFEKRTDPAKLMPGAKSVIVVLLNYFPHTSLPEKNNFILSKYAYGNDYHKIIKSMLKKLHQTIYDEVVVHKARILVDTAPVLERAWAARAGLGWIGKNANLISPEYGSYVFIGELLVNVELEYDKPMRDLCGSCTKCLQACPTHAIVKPKTIDSRLCISYWTIENKGPIAKILKGKFRNRIFGCDICQDVCPWNRKAKPNTTNAFQPSPNLVNMTKYKWQQLSEEKYNQLFEKSAVKRAKYEGLKRNIRFVGG